MGMAVDTLGLCMKRDRLTQSQAWNIRQANRANTWRPSAEFVESGLIFFYGATNIFLEHLSNWDGKWEARDLEHVSITVLFIGGGLVRVCLLALMITLG